MPKYTFQIDTGTTKLTPATLIAAIHGFFGITATIRNITPKEIISFGTEVKKENNGNTGKEETPDTSNKGSPTTTT